MEHEDYFELENLEELPQPEPEAPLTYKDLIAIYSLIKAGFVAEDFA